ncbi:unnamed protein product [Microthlaspi erraticum]|uniref:F-box domain-containing protein n=1 Tax=Microthlaspi erraticum TaxID=1685480 RepID=A0A6D2I1A0_9BRAS|nr:unnamed protein product [Microthlaspi erraticum]
MMMSDLPADLVEEILSRVPATSLKRLRSTCKEYWNSTLFKEPRFTEKHFRQAPKQFRVLMWKDCRVYPMNIDLNVIPPSIELKGALDLKYSLRNSEQLDIAEVFHCDGLLLCFTKDNRLVVCNPCLGETRLIQHENSYKYSTFALGYENNKSVRNYKILMYWECWEKNDKVSGFEIYDFSSNTWRASNAPNWVRARFGGVTLKGNSYWITRGDGDNLLRFDFTKERFGRLCLPPSHNHGYKSPSVVREEKLSVLQHNFDTLKIEIWVTNKFETEADLLWSKSFTVGLHLHNSSIPPFRSLLIDEEKKVILCCDSSCYWERMNVVYIIGEDDGYYKKIPYKQDPCWPSINKVPCIFNYVPSLVQIQ